jgi:hypothetical protein
MMKTQVMKTKAELDEILRKHDNPAFEAQAAESFSEDYVNGADVVEDVIASMLYCIKKRVDGYKADGHNAIASVAFRDYPRLEKALELARKYALPDTKAITDLMGGVKDSLKQVTDGN